MGIQGAFSTQAVLIIQGWIAAALNHRRSSSCSKPKTPDPGELGDDQHLKRRYEIRLNVREVAKDEIIYVHNAVTYISAFDGQAKEWFHTHVNFPTESISFILLFPQGQPCKSVLGLEEVGKGKRQEVDKQKGFPIIVDDGKLVYWRIPNPLLGAEYQLEWEWDNAATMTEATGS